MNRQELEATISQLVIKQLEQGIVPWRKGWSGLGIAPTSLTTGKNYQGINSLVLSIVGEEYSSPFWLTYLEATKRGGYVRKGEKATSIIKWSKYEREDKSTGEKSQGYFMRSYAVFNLDQCDNVEAPEAQAITKREPVSVEAGIASILASYTDKPTIDHRATDRAFYRPSTDTITLPKLEQFNSSADYSATLTHELIHSTGHKSRLDRHAERDLDKPCHFGSENYAKEELVAELGAQFLMNGAGIDTSGELTNSASYLAGWLGALKNDSSLIVSSAGKAQRATDYILKQTQSA
jgi:antirestriction protein ArdC